MSKSPKLGFPDYQASDESFFDLFARFWASNEQIAGCSHHPDGDCSEKAPLRSMASPHERPDRFHMFQVLENEPGEYSYPALIQGKSGDLHMAYTSNRKTIRYVKLPLTAIPN